MCVTTPLISVIIPIYNVETYIMQAVDSVINQTYRNLEIILVDDGSTDNSGKICDEYVTRDHRIVAIHKENGGVSSARNVGIEAATGEWIYFMDSDDWIELNLFERFWEEAKKTNVDLLCFRSDRAIGNIIVPSGGLSCRDGTKTHLFENLSELDAFVNFGCRGSMCVCITNAHVVKAHMRFIEDLAYGEDFIYRIELYHYLKSFLSIPDPLYHYRKNINSVCNIKNWDKHFDSYHRMYKIGCELIQQHDYPEDAIKVVNGFIINMSYRDLLNDVFDNPTLSKKEIKSIFKSFLSSDLYKECAGNMDPRTLGRTSKLILLFKKPPILYIYFLCWLRRTKSSLDLLIENMKMLFDIHFRG